MNIQEREHWDYKEGCQSEFQNAFQRSRSEIQLKDETKKAEELTNQGKFVLMYQGDVCCPCTDAFIGTNVVICGVYDDKIEAEKNIGQDTFLYKKRIIPQYVPPTSNDDAPF